MEVSRQEAMLSSGRVNQKRRTRSAIVDAARELLAEGVTPTVPQAAELAAVSRTTAYRYFPTQDSLLLEAAMTGDVDEIEDLVSRPVTAAGARTRTLEVLELFNRHVAEAEVQYRAALRVYLDQWLEAAEEGGPPPEVREGRRRRWFEQCLAPLRSTIDDGAWEQVVVGLCLLTGPEARTVLGDVARVDDDAGGSIVRWAAEALLDATFGPAPS